MKNIYVCLIGLLATFVVVGTTADSVLLSQVKKKYSSESTIMTEFIMKTWWNVREREESKKGTVVIAPGDKFHVSLGNDLFISNGTVYYQYSSASKQLQIKNLVDIDLSMHPSRLLTTFLTQYPLKEIKRMGQEVLFGWTADSTSTSSYMSVDVTVDTKGTITILKLTDKNMNVFTYTFTKTKFGGTVPKGVFEFEQPSDTQVMDER